MSSAESTADERPPPPRFTLRGALTAYTVVGVLLSIPLIGLGFTLTAVILLCLCLLQLPLFVLFGAFRPSDGAAAGAVEPAAMRDEADVAEWDRWRDEPGRNP